jgi:predicted metal-binding protein
MPEIIGKIVTADEVAEFYKRYPDFWFLLEVLKTSANGKAKLMRVAGYDKNKDVLREYLLEAHTDLDSKYIFVYAYPDGKCDL